MAGPPRAAARGSSASTCCARCAGAPSPTPASDAAGTCGRTPSPSCSACSPPATSGADIWRLHRLTRAGLGRGDAVMSVGTDRFVGAIGLASFVGLRRYRAAGEHAAGRARRRRCRGRGRTSSSAGSGPICSPAGRSPRRASCAHACCSRPATSSPSPRCCSAPSPRPATTLSPLAVLGAFGASQIAGAMPGPNGASPRDGALVVALVATGRARGPRRPPRSRSRPRWPGSPPWPSAG